jgi:K+-sensing histidine kinase KdpD
MTGFTPGFVLGLLVGVGGLFLIFLLGASFAEHESRHSEVSRRNKYFAWLVPIVGAAAVCYIFNLVDSAVVIMLLLAVLAVAKIGGFGKGLLATGLCAAALAIVFLPDAGTFWIHERNDKIVVTLFLVCATLASVLAGYTKKIA